MGDSRQCLFSFGVIADVQYADKDDNWNYHETFMRYYRGAVDGLMEAVKAWNGDEDIEFIVNLGDIIDGFNTRTNNSDNAMTLVVSELNKFTRGPVYNVIGNHEHYNFDRLTIYERLNAAPKGSPYYQFQPHPGFTFIILDTYDLSVIGPGGDAEKELAEQILWTRNSSDDGNNPVGPGGVKLQGVERRFVAYNGGIGPQQLLWLEACLGEAERRGDKVVLFGHTPGHPDSANYGGLLWNFPEMFTLLRRFTCVVAWLSGHDHPGGYAQDEESGVHCVTLEAVLETEPGVDCFGRVDVMEDRLVINGRGRLTSRVLLFPSHQKKVNGNSDGTAAAGGEVDTTWGVILSTGSVSY